MIIRKERGMTLKIYNELNEQNNEILKNIEETQASSCSVSMNIVNMYTFIYIYICTYIFYLSTHRIYLFAYPPSGASYLGHGHDRTYMNFMNTHTHI